MNWIITGVGIGAAVAATGAAQTIDIDSRLQLFTDDYIIDQIRPGAHLRLHRPIPRNIAIVCDKPWEGNISGYWTVFRDGDLYRMYYRGGHVAYTEGEMNQTHRQVTCYLESSDGINWQRPELRLFEFDGSKQNNIILDGQGTHNFTPFKDANPDCRPKAQYKAVATGQGGLWAFTSPDGINWEPLTDGPVITQGAFDSQNLAFWDTVRGEYRAYWRDFRPEGADVPPGRDIKTATSADFLNWSEPKWLGYTPGRRGTDETDPPYHQLYTNAVIPYYRAPHIFLGFPTRYIDHGWTPSTEQLPNLEYRRISSSKSTREGTAFTDGLFMSSHDGLNFRVWPEAFIRPGIHRPGAWFYGDNYQAWGIVETEPHLKGAPNELSIYASEHAKQRQALWIRRYTLRVDGFVSAHAPLGGGELLTKPVNYDGEKLVINFATSAGGSVRVELQDADGNALPGRALDDCVETYGDELDRTVRWEDGTHVSEFAGTPVRIRFELKDADLYSFRFS